MKGPDPRTRPSEISQSPLCSSSPDFQVSRRRCSRAQFLSLLLLRKRHRRRPISSGFHEYEYKIDARTGAIVGTKKLDIF